VGSAGRRRGARRRWRRTWPRLPGRGKSLGREAVAVTELHVGTPEGASFAVIRKGDVKMEAPTGHATSGRKIVEDPGTTAIQVGDDHRHTRLVERLGRRWCSACDSRPAEIRLRETSMVFVKCGPQVEHGDRSGPPPDAVPDQSPSDVSVESGSLGVAHQRLGIGRFSGGPARREPRDTACWARER